MRPLYALEQMLAEAEAMHELAQLAEKWLTQYLAREWWERMP